MNIFPTLIKREYWEHKGGFLWAPIAAGSIFLVFNLLMLAIGQVGANRSNIQLGAIKLNDVTSTMDARQLQMLGVGLDATMLLVASLVMLVVGIVVFFYCLSSLYDERRDRSVLFWKSMPVSDTQTVLSKVTSALLLAPAIGIAAGILTAIGFLLLVAGFMAVNGVNAFGLIASHGSPVKMTLLLAAQLPIYALWALPTVGWLMLCSAWARSKPFLWAVGVPVAVGILVSWFDVMRTLRMPDTSIWSDGVARLLFSVLPGGWIETSRFENVKDPTELMSLLSIGHTYSVLLTPSVWIWAAAGAGMIFAAIRLRRWRDEG